LLHQRQRGGERVLVTAEIGEDGLVDPDRERPALEVEGRSRSRFLAARSAGGGGGVCAGPFGFSGLDSTGGGDFACGEDFGGGRAAGGFALGFRSANVSVAIGQSLYVAVRTR
jgi:hypothetical protein